MKFERLGWIVAASLAGAMVGMGFQTPAQKLGSVDMGKVFGDSDFVKTMRNDLSTAQKTRTDILQFIGDNKAMKPEDAQKYANLAVKTNASAADKTEVDRITQDARAASTKQRELATKATLTDAESKQMADYTNRATQNTQLQQQLAGVYDQDLRDLQERLRNQTLDRVRNAVKEVATKQGYTIVFAQDIAPYAANDLTAEALTAMNKKK